MNSKFLNSLQAVGNFKILDVNTFEPIEPKKEEKKSKPKAEPKSEKKDDEECKKAEPTGRVDYLTKYLQQVTASD